MSTCARCNVTDKTRFIPVCTRPDCPGKEDVRPLHAWEAEESVSMGMRQTSETIKRDWPEDFDLENGNYQCRCVLCGQSFFGYKRRLLCKLCSKQARMDEPPETWNPWPLLLFFGAVFFWLAVSVMVIRRMS